MRTEVPLDALGEPFNKQREPGTMRLPEVKMLVAEGHLSVYKGEFDLSWPSEARVSDHVLRDGSTTSSESEKHVRFKLLGVNYLVRRGHELETTLLDSDTASDLAWRYDCFETYVGRLTCDVVCACDDCCTAVEVGYTPANRVLRAFGYAPLGGMPDRTDESELDELAVIPYGPQPGEEAPVYVFERTEAMPEVDLSDFAETVANAFEADRERGTNGGDS